MRGAEIKGGGLVVVDKAECLDGMRLPTGSNDQFVVHILLESAL